MFVLIPPFLGAAVCTEQEAIESETTAAYIKSWQELKAHYHKYGHCDDGAIAEGYSESVSYLMETKWPEFLDYEMDKSFFSFVKGHVDETWETGRIKKVAESATSNCNETKRPICDAILDITHNQ
jgi:hypothetical protein